MISYTDSGVRAHDNIGRQFTFWERVARVPWEYRFLRLPCDEGGHGRLLAAWKAIGYAFTGRVYCSAKKWRWCWRLGRRRS